jgi:hypothetical protein
MGIRRGSDDAGIGAARPHLDMRFPVFSARVVEHGQWRTLAEPQRQPGNACFPLAAYIVREDPSVSSKWTRSTTRSAP